MHTTTNRNKSLQLSKLVYDDMKNYAKITDTPINALIREALVDFFRHTETKTEREYLTIKNQRSILSDVKVPGETNEVKINYYIRKKDLDLIDKLNPLEKHEICHSTEDCIRRILTWYLQKQNREMNNEQDN